MPDEPRRRIILEKSSTVRRRYQRSNKRFKFSAEEIARIEREKKAEKRAKELREKEEKRIEKKKKKAEKEARDREERRRRGLPDPNAPKVSSSQPLLSNFLAKRPAPVEDAPVEDTPVEDTPAKDTPAKDPSPEPGSDHEPTTTETETDNHDGVASAEVESAAGDTEVDSDFDDLDQELEREMSNLPDAGVLEDSEIHDAGHDTSKDTLQTMCTDREDDEFSNCSALEEFMEKAAGTATMQSAQDTPDIKIPAPSKPLTLLQPPSSNSPKDKATLVASFGDSFRDETADCLEEGWLNGELAGV